MTDRNPIAQGALIGISGLFCPHGPATFKPLPAKSWRGFSLPCRPRRFRQVSSELPGSRSGHRSRLLNLPWRTDPLRSLSQSTRSRAWMRPGNGSGLIRGSGEPSPDSRALLARVRSFPQAAGPEAAQGASPSPRARTCSRSRYLGP